MNEKEFNNLISEDYKLIQDGLHQITTLRSKLVQSIITTITNVFGGELDMENEDIDEVFCYCVDNKGNINLAKIANVKVQGKCIDMIASGFDDDNEYSINEDELNIQNLIDLLESITSYCDNYKAKGFDENLEMQELANNKEFLNFVKDIFSSIDPDGLGLTKEQIEDIADDNYSDDEEVGDYVKFYKYDKFHIAISFIYDFDKDKYYRMNSICIYDESEEYSQSMEYNKEKDTLELY